MADPFAEQIGGDHYRQLKIGFIEGSVVKYVTRHRLKGGRDDLEKAIHCLQLLIELEYPGRIVVTEQEGAEL